MQDVDGSGDRLPQPPEADDRTRAAIDAIGFSDALQAAVSRRHLDLPLGDVMHPLPDEGAQRTEAAVFLRLTQIGKPLAGSAGDALTALQNVLTTCHAPGRFTLVFLLASDGTQNSVYLGAQSHDFRSSAKEFLRTIASFLEANWPGTQLTPVEASDETFQRMVERPLGPEASAYAVALTGVPSQKPGEARDYPQTLDRLLNGMRGKPFVYMVIAEPIAVCEVDDVLDRCRNLTSEVHVFSKIILNSSTRVQETNTESQILSQGVARSEAETRDWNLTLGGYVGSKDAGGATIQGGRRWSSMKSRTFTDTATFGAYCAKGLSTGADRFKEYIDTHAQAVESQLQRYVQRFEEARAFGCWNVGIYVLMEREDLVRQGGMQAKALLTGPSSFQEPIRIHDLHKFQTDTQPSLASFRQPNLGRIRQGSKVNEALTAADRVEHLLGPLFSGLTTPLNTEELALLTNLPQREVAGIPLQPTASFSLNVAVSSGDDIILGRLIDSGRPTEAPYPISLRMLANHTLVTGVAGSGKSTSCLRILRELLEKRVPFLVIEPSKDEYVDWAMHLNDAKDPAGSGPIRVYMPGAEIWRGRPLNNPLAINPLDVIWLAEDHRPAVLSHVDRLKSILSGSLPMPELLPALLEDVLCTVYSTPCDWLNDTMPPFGSPRPTLQQMRDAVHTVVRQKNQGAVTENLAALVTARLNNLCCGWKSKLFCQPESTFWPDIFDKPTVINLSRLGDDADRAFAMAIILHFLYEYRRAQLEVDPLLRQRTTTLRHLTVVEEAHRIVRRRSGENSPQSKVAQMFCDVLSEVRSYGEGLLVVDQVPARLEPDAVKNTNLKIVHRVVAEDDRAATCGVMMLTAEQAAMMSRLRVGQAIVYSDQDDMAAWVEVAR